MIHKRLVDNRRNGNKTWQMCDNSISFSGSEYSLRNPSYAQFSKIAKYSWHYVTCPKCLELQSQSWGQPLKEKSLKYAWRYPNGKWVARDDSTGPMSSGGYPYEVDSFDRATLFDTVDAAFRYRGPGTSEGFKDWELYTVTLTAQFLTRAQLQSIGFTTLYGKVVAGETL